MTLTIELTPDIEKQLRSEAAKMGIDASRYIVNTLEERLRQSRAESSHLSREESELLQKINLGIAEEKWRRYRDLVAKRRAETLDVNEQTELIALSDQIEQANARRIEYLAELATRRKTPLETLMRELGITAPAYA
jgi:hypothetical protein